jgi:FAD/FMN-containing dehydrogenase
VSASSAPAITALVATDPARPVETGLSRAAPAEPAPAQFESWGRVPTAVHRVARSLEWRSDPLPPIPDGLTALPHGLGRSYGDSCLNDGGALLLTRNLDRFISFDRATGVLRCESGVTIDEICRFAIPQGWFVTVTPGTKFVTLGGAIANDVHGKNHHRAGTFGRAVRAFELLRSDGTRRLCTPTSNADWYRATIGGLGLTGVITWAEIQLRPIQNAFIEVETVKFGGLDEFFDLNTESERNFEYTVSWIDCSTRGKGMGRGHYNRGNHAGPQFGHVPALKEPFALAVPFDLPGWLLSPPMIRLMCIGYYYLQIRKRKSGLTTFDPFFWPLDAIHSWNRGYGRNGFFQYQMVIPMKDARAISQEIFDVITRSGQASFVSVFKTFGDVPSPGLLSFPRPGVTLALDFSNRGEKSLRFFETLDRIVERAGGAIYPAKDARMSGETFRRSFPNWKALEPFIDSRFSSSFWRRVTTPRSEVP